MIMIKKTLKIVVPLLLIVVLAVSGGIMFFKLDGYKAEIAYRDGVIDQLNSKVDNIGPLTTCYELNFDVKSGTVCEESDLTAIEIPEKSSNGYVKDLNEAVGKRYIANIGTGTVLHDSLLYDNDLTGDLRYLDVVCDELPIGLAIGDYVDVRISFGVGQNFICMKRKEVININKQVVKLTTDEADIHTLESMTADKGEYSGVKIYLTQYVNPGTQTIIENYYPLRNEVLVNLVQDPNIKDSVKRFYYADRELLETQLVSKVDMMDSEDSKDYRTKLAALVEQAKASISAQYRSGEDFYKGGQVEGEGGSSSSGDTSAEITGPRLNENGVLVDPSY